MLNRIINKYRTEGFHGLITSAMNKIFPPKLAYFQTIYTDVYEKIGLEIGGPSEKKFTRLGLVPVYKIAHRIDNINYSDFTTYEGKIEVGDTFTFNKNKKPGRQYIAEARDLGFIEDETYDFLISSHCIEHVANPLLAMEEWVRVLKMGGLMILIIPHKDGTFDRKRPVTEWYHLLEDHQQEMGEDDLTHLEEVLKLHDLSLDSSVENYNDFKNRSLNNVENRNLHHHVFNTPLALKMLDFVGLKILTVEHFQPCHIVLVARKARLDEEVDNDCYLAEADETCWKSPFPSDEIN